MNTFLADLSLDGTLLLGKAEVTIRPIPARPGQYERTMKVSPDAWLAIVNSEHVEPLIHVPDGRTFEIKDSNQKHESFTFDFEIIRKDGLADDAV
jgi:hypothetical protein